MVTRDIDADPGTRQRLVQAMTHALRRRGLHGVGLAEVLADAQAPKGVLYHHFPGGKTALAVAAIDESVAALEQALLRLMQQGVHPVQGLRSWLGGARKVLGGSGFDVGCPLAAVALESTSDDVELRAALARGFALLRERVAQWLQQAGVPPERSIGLSTLVVAAYEGALMQARVAGSLAPMNQATDALLDLLVRELAPPGSAA